MRKGPENYAVGELTPSVDDLINNKYDELQRARLMLMNIEKQLSVPTSPSEADRIDYEYNKLKVVIPQLEQEFEAMKAARAMDLENRFGASSTNAATIDSPLIEGSNDDLLNRRLG